jgi:hypothetical protein
MAANTIQQMLLEVRRVGHVARMGQMRNAYKI